MEIFVLVKTVPDAEARMELLQDGSGLRLEEKWELSFFDAIAVEQALRIKEKMSGVRVSALSYGPRFALEGLRKAVAMGADRAIHLEASQLQWVEPMEVAWHLAQALRKENPELILCGRKATDDEAAQVGPMVAGFLGIPYLGPAVALELQEAQGSLEVVADLGGAREKLRCRLPALVSAQKGLAEPRVPTIQGVMKGMRLQPEKMGLEKEHIPQAGWRLRGFGRPAGRAPVRMIQGDDAASKARELLRLLKQEAKLL